MIFVNCFQPFLQHFKIRAPNSTICSSYIFIMQIIVITSKFFFFCWGHVLVFRFRDALDWTQTFHLICGSLMAVTIFSRDSLNGIFWDPSSNHFLSSTKILIRWWRLFCPRLQSKRGPSFWSILIVSSLQKDNQNIPMRINC